MISITPGMRLVTRPGFALEQKTVTVEHVYPGGEHFSCYINGYLIAQSTEDYEPVSEPASEENTIHKITEDGLNCARCGAAITHVESGMFGGLCVDCYHMQIPVPLLQGEYHGCDCDACRAKLWQYCHCLNCWKLAHPEPVQQSEYERLMDEIAHATQQCNEMAERLEDLIEQARVARGKEVELAPPLNLLAKKEQAEMAIVGWFNWVDTVCVACVERLSLDVSDFSPLTLKDACKDDCYDCDYCGQEFPPDPVWREYEQSM